MAKALSEATNIDWIQTQEQASVPATPASGYGRWYSTNTGKPAHVNDAGTAQILYVNPEIFIPAALMHPSTTAGCAALAQSETTTHKINYKSLDFDQSTEEYAQFLFITPDDWNAGTITAAFYWTAASGTGNVIWAIQGIALANDDALDTAWGTAQTVTDTLIATGDMHVTPVTAAMTFANTPTAGEPVFLRVYRAAADGGDTLSADAKLIGLKLYYTRA